MSDQPNILVIMSDQHAPSAVGAMGNKCVKTPHLDALALRGVTFTQAYCPYPMCTPSRASFMTGLNTPQHDVWELGTPLSTALPTWPHALRTAGYCTSIAGRMHFMGPDQMHGFERRVAPDGYIGKSPWAYDPWLAPITDEHVMIKAIQKAGVTKDLTYNQKTDERTHDAAIAELSFLTKQRKETGRPWALTASYIQPHFPFVVSQKWWDMYEGVDIEMPELPPDSKGYASHIPELMQGSRRWLGCTDDGLKEDEIRSAIRAYYGMITLIDDYIGQLIAQLDAAGVLENTIILYTSDHGDNMGSHGMWSKLNFYEESVGIPFIVAGPGIEPNRKCAAPVSLVDWLATLLAMNEKKGVGINWPSLIAGQSLWPLLEDPSQVWADRVVVSDYACGGTRVPLRMVRRGKYKACFGPPLPAVLFDLEADPREGRDLGADPVYAPVLAELYACATADGWNPELLLTHIHQQKRTLDYLRQAETVNK